MRQIVPATKCPISSPATKCPTDDPTEKPLFHWHFSGDKLSQGDKMSHFLPGDKMSQLMHLCTWKLWKVVGTFCRQWKRLLGQFVASEKGHSQAYLGGYFSVRRHYNITVCYKNIRERQVGQFVAIEKGDKYWAHLGHLTLIAIKHCQRHNGPEGWVQIDIVTSWGYIRSSNKNLDHISSSESWLSIN